jgi:hypothetical protein
MSFRPGTLRATGAALILASASLPISALAQATESRPEYRTASPEHGGIVFTGSSIFRFWTHLTDQMAPLPVLNRAIAGTVTQDMLGRIGQLVLPYQPRIVVYYCGSNDISAGEDGGPIIERTKRFIQILREVAEYVFLLHVHSKGAGETCALECRGRREPRDGTLQPAGIQRRLH